MTDRPDKYIVGEALPLEARMRFAEGGMHTGGAIDLPRQALFMMLADYRPADGDAFVGPARLRVGRMKNFMIISPSFKGFSLDMIWSPVIAKASGEPDLEPVEKGHHPAFSFILLDGDLVVRKIRVATLSPAVGKAIRRARRELMQMDVTAEAVDKELNEIFTRNPNGLHDAMFHEVCDLGD